LTVKFGIIGCGYISKHHIEAIVQCTDAKLLAISDLQNDRMTEAISYYRMMSDEKQTIYQYENYTDMLKNNDVDVVVICTISSLHAEMAKSSLLAGKHVILEKPMTLSLKEADEIIQLANANNCKMMVCHQMRFRPVMQEIKNIIDDGKLGRLYLGVASIRLNRSPEYYSDATWRGDWSKDGGMLINQGIHVIDLLQWFLGDVEKVYGDLTTFSKLKETEDVALGVLSFTNQAKGVIEANVITQPKNLGYHLSIYGEKGCISLEGPKLNQLSRWYVADEDTDLDQIKMLLDDQNEQVYMYENFIQSLINPEKNLLISGEQGKKALETIFALYQSSLTQKPQELPLKSFSTGNMKTKGGSA
jgi:predicted dehydrogenase